MSPTTGTQLEQRCAIFPAKEKCQPILNFLVAPEQSDCMLMENRQPHQWKGRNIGFPVKWNAGDFHMVALYTNAMSWRPLNNYLDAERHQEMVVDPCQKR